MPSIGSHAGNHSAFSGAKVLLFIGPALVVLKRDDRPDIPFPGYWDLPGGGRDGDETPADCVCRETWEETGLVLHATDLIWRRVFQTPVDTTWMFAAQLALHRSDELVLGDEGQALELMAPDHYQRHPLAIPHFAERLQLYLSERGFQKTPRS